MLKNSFFSSEISFIKMAYKKKIKKKITTSNNGLAKIATLTTNSISSVFSNYKKNKK